MTTFSTSYKQFVELTIDVGLNLWEELDTVFGPMYHFRTVLTMVECEVGYICLDSYQVVRADLKAAMGIDKYAKHTHNICTVIIDIFFF